MSESELIDFVDSFALRELSASIEQSITPDCSIISSSFFFWVGMGWCWACPAAAAHYVNEQNFGPFNQLLWLYVNYAPGFASVQLSSACSLLLYAASPWRPCHKRSQHFFCLPQLRLDFIFLAGDPRKKQIFCPPTPLSECALHALLMAGTNKNNNKKCGLIIKMFSFCCIFLSILNASFFAANLINSNNKTK